MSNKTLTRNGYILQKKYLSATEQNKIKKDLTVSPLVLPAFKSFQKPKPYKIYLESPERLFLPRYYGIEKFGEPLNSNITPGLDIDVIVHISLRPHQIAAAKNIMKQFGLEFRDPSSLSSNDTSDPIPPNPLDQLSVKSDTKANQEVEKPLKTEVMTMGGVLSLPCGYGKTVLAIWTIAQLKKKTLVVVNKEFLMDQWIDSFEKFSNCRVGILQQNKMEIDGNDVVVAMLHSICLKDYPKGIFEEFGLVIFDECHHIASDMFSKALPKVASKYMLGLSATPERKDGLSRVFYAYLGKLFHQERRSGSNLVVVKQIRCMSNSPYYQELFMKTGGTTKVKNTNAMLTQLIEFEERNRMILYVLSLLIKQGRTILVLSSRREHLEWIYNALQQANLRKSNGTFATYGLYWGNQHMNKKQYKKMLEESSKCDIVLGTCQLAQEGLDIPTLDTLLFATPMTDIIQAVGRILRKYHKINPYVIDIVDKFGNFQKHLKKRQEFYDEEEYYSEYLNVILHDQRKDNAYDELLQKFIDNNPDLTEFEARRTENQKNRDPNSTTFSATAVKTRGKPPTNFKQVVLNIDDDVDEVAGEDDEEDEFDFASRPIRALPLGCQIESGFTGDTDSNHDLDPTKKIPLKIVPKISTINKLKVERPPSPPKSRVTDLNQPILAPKIKVTPIITPKLKASDANPIAITPKLKASEANPGTITPKLRASEANPVLITTKLRACEANPSVIVPKMKVSDMPVVTSQKMKVIANPVSTNGKIKVSEIPSQYETQPKLKMSEIVAADKQAKLEAARAAAAAAAQEATKMAKLVAELEQSCDPDRLATGSPTNDPDKSKEIGKITGKITRKFF